MQILSQKVIRILILGNRFFFCRKKFNEKIECIEGNSFSSQKNIQYVMILIGNILTLESRETQNSTNIEVLTYFRVNNWEKSGMHFFSRFSTNSIN